MVTISNVLLSTDFSDFSLSAADYAITVAKLNDATLHLLHVVEKTPPILAIRSLDLSEDKILKGILSEAQENLEKVVKKLETESGLKVVASVVRGIDYQEIVDYAAGNKVDMIVIATHGRTGLLHTLIGSVAEKVIRYSKVPVLVVTPGEAKS
ncbi:MAG: universal stress protein [Ignavibacteriaceae bacterium]|nr:universal stress protein [Ignavibacteriaceae bacterium]